MMAFHKYGQIVNGKTGKSCTTAPIQCKTQPAFKPANQKIKLTISIQYLSSRKGPKVGNVYANLIVELRVL